MTVKTPTEPVKAIGLENVIALESEICFIDGQKGILIYRGYEIQDLAANTSFEEVAHLLWYGKLPNRRELDTLLEQLRSERSLPEEVIDILRQAPAGVHPMAVLRTAISALSHHDAEAEDGSEEANYRKAIRLTAKLPGLVAMFDRLRKGKPVVYPRGEGSTAREFLYMLNGEEPGEMAERTLDIALILHAEHGLNASTFTGRVISSTLSDMYSAVTGAMGALKGPLHGGANMEVMRTLLEIDRQGIDPAEFVRQKLARKERVMGFGHRVYKTFDPRAAILRDMLKKLSEEKGEMKWYEYQMKMMEVMEKEKGLYPNVDFFSAPVYYLLGIDIDLYTPIFAMARMTGWTAHIMEQYRHNRLIRPRAEYVGPRGLKVEPIDRRS